MSRMAAHRAARTGIAAAALCAALTGGCATAPGELFEPANRTYAWPPPPDQPRIGYLGAFGGEADLRRGKGGFEALGEALFGSTPTELFVSPVAVCSDGGQRIFVADSHARAVHVMNLETRAYLRIAPTKPEEVLGLPVSVAAWPDGRLLVSDAVAGSIAVFDAAGTRTGTIGTGALNRPAGLALDTARARLAVADPGVHQVVIFDDSGHEIARVGRRGSAPGEFNYPTHVAWDRDGRLYVSDTLNFRVQVFGPDLQPLRQIGRKGDMPGYFAQPKGLGVDAAGHVFVVDAHFEAVQVFDASGALLMAFGHEGQGPGEFWLPSGLCTDSTGRVWVADSYNRRVQAFQILPEGGQP